MAVSFARDIRPLFTEVDIAHMKGFGVLLDDFDYMRDPAHAQKALDAVKRTGDSANSSGKPPWSPDRVQLFRDWIAAGYQA